MKHHCGPQLYSVWNNTPEDDSIIAVDLTARECAKLLGIRVSSVHEKASRGDGARGNGTILIRSATQLGMDSDMDGEDGTDREVCECH